MSYQILKSSHIHSLITPKLAADALGISIGTLQVWRSTGRYNLPYVKVGGRVMYRSEDLQAFIERRTMDHTE
ncbi:MAG: helix-turn-helix domain-containing protein [Candidatus Thiodiazotropha taylori]